MTDRAVSTVVSYVLLLGITAILVSALVGGVAPVVLNQQQATAQSTMTVVGNDLAGDIETADRLAQRNGGEDAVEVRSKLPERIGGSEYNIEISPAENGDTSDVILRTDDFESSAVVSVRTNPDLVSSDDEEEFFIDGGHVIIQYDGDDLVIKNA